MIALAFVLGWMVVCYLLGSIFNIGAVGILLYPALGVVTIHLYVRYASWDDDRNAKARRWQAFIEDSRTRLSNQDKAFNHVTLRLLEAAEQTRRSIRRIMGEDDDGHGRHGA